MVTSGRRPPATTPNDRSSSARRRNRLQTTSRRRLAPFTIVVWRGGRKLVPPPQIAEGGNQRERIFALAAESQHVGAEPGDRLAQGAIAVTRLIGRGGGVLSCFKPSARALVIVAPPFGERRVARRDLGKPTTAFDQRRLASPFARSEARFDLGEPAARAQGLDMAGANSGEEALDHAVGKGNRLNGAEP